MLKQRVLTALVLVPLVLWAIISLPDKYFAILLALVIILGAKEWTVMARLSSPMSFVFVAVFIPVLYLAWKLIHINTGYIAYILFSACAWWFIAFMILLSYNKGNTKIVFGRLSRSIIGMFILVPTFVALYWLRTDAGYILLLYLLMLIWIADSAAYFSGKRWGKDKLLPNVSPGKTWQGVFGALVASILFSIIFALGTEVVEVSRVPVFVLVSFISVIFSIHGDLTESLFKRQVGIKDSGQLLPGHGGILDRIDSLTSASPVFSTGLILMSSNL